jgi:ABC-2 type transport system permease protein
MRQVLFFWPGSFRPAANSKLEFKQLAVTGRNSGSISYQEVDMLLRGGNMFSVRRNTTREPYIVAARVSGEIMADEDLKLEDVAKTEGEEPSEEEDALAGKAPEKAKLNVVLVSDIDWIAPIIFRLREMGEDQDMVVDFKFQNVPFVLNILDSLAGDDRFIDLRKRTRAHRILTKVEEATEDFRKVSLEEQTKFFNDARQQIEAAQQEFRTKMAELESRTDLDPRVRAQMMERERIRLERIRDVKISALEAARNRQVKQSERELAAQIRGVQDRYKFLAVALPPILPILLAFFVFFHRRKAEQEGVDARRLRYGRPQETAAPVEAKK